MLNSMKQFAIYKSAKIPGGFYWIGPWFFSMQQSVLKNVGYFFLFKNKPGL